MGTNRELQTHKTHYSVSEIRNYFLKYYLPCGVHEHSGIEVYYCLSKKGHLNIRFNAEIYVLSDVEKLFASLPVELVNSEELNRFMSLYS